MSFDRPANPFLTVVSDQPSVDEPAHGPTLAETVSRDVAALTPLVGLEPSLAASALRLAEEIDAGAGEGRYLAALNKELRATLEQLFTGRQAEPEDRQEAETGPDVEDDLDQPG